VKQNLTLIVDEDLLQSARKAASDRNTSLNRLVCVYLEQLVQESEDHRASAAELAEIFGIPRARCGTHLSRRDRRHD
jgi:hypothetical protein